jgi:methanogen homoaconitase large subunit
MTDMGQTLSERILSNAAGRPVHAGQVVIVRPDVVMGHDALAPSVIQIMHEQLKLDLVHDPDQIVLVVDHVVPAASISTANSQADLRRFAQEQGIRLFDTGRGICHQVLIEEGIAQPGRIIVGSDSHSTSYGSVGAFGTGMGSTDIALVWATGRTWLRVPETIRVQVIGRFKPGVEAKDLALKLEQILKISGANYAAVEYHGLDWMPLHDRQTLCSMAVELGAKTGIVPPTGIEEEGYQIPDWLGLDPAAEYIRTITIDLETLEPQIAVPHAVDQVFDLADLVGTPINQVFLGTCTNGRYADMQTAAQILEGKRIADSVRLIITPASNREMMRAMEDGTLKILIEAGGAITTPGCGACLGRHQGTLGDGEICLSTGNRNFKGRMGASSAQIFLASPTTAAISALTGHISFPLEYTH